MISHDAMKRWLVPVAALCVALGTGLGMLAESLLPCLVCCALALAGVLLLKDRLRVIAVWMLAAYIGLCAGQHAHHPALPQEGDCLVSGIVAQEIRNGNGSQRKTVLRQVTLDGKPFSAGAYWSFYTDEVPEELAPGVRVTINARVYHPSGPDNPGGYDFRGYLLGQGVTIGVYGMNDLACADAGLNPTALIAKARHALTRQMLRVMGEEAGGYAAAMLLGVRDLVPDEDMSAFRRLGIAHILSVSGYHVGVLYALIAALMTLLHIPRRWRMLPLTMVVGLYALLTGLHAPVVRAGLLLLLGEYGVLHGRQRLGLHMLSASAIIMLLWSPAQLTSASFHLTYGALLGITLIAPRLERLLGDPLRYSRPRQLLCASVAAQIGILLPELYWFHELPVLGIVFNVLLLAAFSALLTLYWVVSALMFIPAVGTLGGRLAAALTAVMVRGVRLSDSAPWLTLWTKQANLVTAIGWLMLFAGLCALWRRFGKRQALLAVCGAAVMALSLVPWPFAGTRYMQLSVSNADAAILQDGGKTYAIDTGDDGKSLANWLHQQRLGLDVLFITHLHSDHAGGVRALLDTGIPIGVCYIPAGMEQVQIDAGMAELLLELQGRGTPVIPLTRGDTIPLANGAATVLWPEKGHIRPESDANLYSLAMLVSLRGSTMLLTGDLDGTYENYAAVPADVLKVAHHGSAASTSAAYLRAVAPQCAVLSGGDEARFLRVKELCGDTPLYSTWQTGAAIIDFTDTGFRVRTYHPQP